MFIGEVIGRWLWGSSSEYLSFVGAMLATGCKVAAVYRGGRWLVTEDVNERVKSIMPREGRADDVHR